MGVIKRQGIKSTIVNYFGVIIGFVGSLFIYPLNRDVHGNILFLIAQAGIIIPFLTFGFSGILTKFYPVYKEKHGENGFIFFALLTILKTLVITVSCVFLVRYLALTFSIEQIPQIITNELFYYTIIFGITLTLIETFKQFSVNNLRITIPSILESIGFKLVIISTILLSLYFKVELHYLFLILFCFYLFNLFFLIVYNYKLNKKDFKKIRISKIDKSFKTSLNNFWLFAGINSFGSMLIYNIDSYMIGNSITKEHISIYSMFVVISGVIIIPMRSFVNIAVPIVSTAMNNENFKKINDLYKSLSTNLVIFGVFIFSIIWINFPELFKIMSEGEIYKPYKNIFLFIGLAKIFDLSTSINHYIINFSKLYKINFFTLILTAILNVILNIYFIDLYGIIGVAIATSISIFLLNLTNSIIVFFLFKMQPFQFNMVIPFGILIMIIAFSEEILLTEYFLSNVILKTGIFTSLFFTIVFYTKISTEINDNIHILVTKIKNLL